MVNDFQDEKIEKGIAEGKQVNVKIAGMQISFKNSQRDYRQDLVIQAHKNNGLEYEHLIKGQSRIRVIERALQKAKQKNLLREIENTPEKTRYQFTEEFINENSLGEKYVDFKVSEFITYYKQTDKVVCDNPNKQEMIEKLIEYCAERFTVTDVSRYIKKLLEDCHLIPIINSGGGSFFIPYQFKDKVTAIKKMFKEIDKQGIFHITHIYTHEEERESMEENIKTYKSEKMKVIKEKFERIQKEGNEITRTIHKNTLEELVYEMKDIEFYSDLLEMEFSESKELLKNMTQFVTNAFMGIPNEKIEEKKEDKEPSEEDMEKALGI
jgi:hypothetical protein